MGSIISSYNQSNVEQLDISANSAYRYPPKSGCYFGGYFTMGGQRFETPQPEAYLFGENSDLNYLGSRPAPFPYPPPQPNEPTKTLKSLVNIRKDSVKLVKDNRNFDTEEESTDMADRYNLEFVFDSEAKVAITVYLFATEEIVNGQHAVYQPKEGLGIRSETFQYQKGANQLFKQPAFIINPGRFTEADFNFDPLKDLIPVVIQCCVDEGDEHAGHSHALLATLDKVSDDLFVIKPLKQKQMVEGVYYLLQEIYGIENKKVTMIQDELDNDALDDNGSDCVICMSDARDTLILPCRHLCLCNGCADSLRYQSSCCPICRAPFRALLQIRALRKVSGVPHADDSNINQENVPQGYEAVPLGEALNGPNTSGNPSLPRLEPSDGSGSGRHKRRNRRKRPTSNSSSSGRSKTVPEAAVTAHIPTAQYAEENEVNKSLENPYNVKKNLPPMPSQITAAPKIDLGVLLGATAASATADEETKPAATVDEKEEVSSGIEALSLETDSTAISPSEPSSPKSDTLTKEVKQESIVSSTDSVFQEQEPTIPGHPSPTPLPSVEIPGMPLDEDRRESLASSGSVSSTRRLLSTPSTVKFDQTYEHTLV
ncbi:probable E3 ubiquitin-protein ligase MGRN1 [Anneissia japonica]|uniref:probable E3 ubiquitin-protein ligase MGRN1 n=1 Tax=Anneissia japonica TaxID=1529436 RepID=UPI001425A280|nr:probable E3 ubiquitin-protein ligase MGRN1 [Anneissia japonica]